MTSVKTILRYTNNYNGILAVCKDDDEYSVEGMFVIDKFNSETKTFNLKSIKYVYIADNEDDALSHFYEMTGRLTIEGAEVVFNDPS